MKVQKMLSAIVLFHSTCFFVTYFYNHIKNLYHKFEFFEN